MQRSLNLTIILDNIRSAYNVGSVLRTADCAGVIKVILCGITPTIDHPKVVKTALGAEKTVPTQYYATLEEGINSIEKDNQVYVLETGEDSHNLWETVIPNLPTTIIFGHEVLGVNLEATKNLPKLFIPMFGTKESLNVANAVAIATYDLIKRWSSN